MSYGIANKTEPFHIYFLFEAFEDNSRTYYNLFLVQSTEAKVAVAGLLSRLTSDPIPPWKVILMICLDGLYNV